MSKSFSFDTATFERAIKDAANEGVKKLAAQYQTALDDVHASHAGQPVEEVQPVLAQRWTEANDGTPLTDPHLSEYSQAIADGRRIVITPEEV